MGRNSPPLNSPRQEAGNTKRERSRAKLLSAGLNALADGNAEPSATELAELSGMGRATVYGLFEGDDYGVDLLRIFGFSLEAPVATDHPMVSAPTQAIVDFVSDSDLADTQTIRLVAILINLIETSRTDGFHIVEILGRVVLTEAFCRIGRVDEALLQVDESNDLLEKYAAATSLGAVCSVRLSRSLALTGDSALVLRCSALLEQAALWAADASRYDVCAISAAELMATRWYFDLDPELFEDLRRSSRLFVERAISGTVGASNPGLQLLNRLANPNRDSARAAAAFLSGGGLSPWSRLLALESLEEIPGFLVGELVGAPDLATRTTCTKAHQTPRLTRLVRDHLRQAVDGDIESGPAVGVLVEDILAEVARLHLGGSLRSSDREALLKALASLKSVLEIAT